MMNRRWLSVLTVALLAWGAGMVGCGSDDDGRKAGGPFAGGFLGLANVEQNVTQCGECHPSQQSFWADTAHGDAWQTLADIGREGIEQSCAPCHNVSDRGSTLMDDSVGFVAEGGNPHLRNVQCENCHGPGADHLADPTNKPVAPIVVDFEVGCGECHQDAHHPFAEEWMESAHARSLEAAGGRVTTDVGCAYCHVAQSFIEFVKSDGENLVLTANPEPITCVACHDPHGNGNEKQLRIIAIGDEDPEPIVCAFCHNSEGAMIGDTPHHPQADLLLGRSGFFFPGVVNPGPATHGNIETNPDLCAACHVVRVPFMREGDVEIPAQVGHTFKPIPVIDEETGERNFENCEDCHAPPVSQVFEPWVEKFDRLAEELEAALDAIPEDSPLRDTEAYQGALFNFEFLESDSSHGVHNPRVAETLLESSIDALAEL